MSQDSKAVIGIYGYTASVGDTFGGVEAHLLHLARHLVKHGCKVVVHCLSTPWSGWHVADGKFQVGPHEREVQPGLWEFTPAHGPGVRGAIEENRHVAARHAEQMAFVFGTRDGWVFDIGIAVADALTIPVVSFIYFTAEERWFRSQFTSRTRSIPGLADCEERSGLNADAVSVLERVLTSSEVVVVPTDYVKGQLSMLSCPTTAARTTTVYHGVDADLFSPRQTHWSAESGWLHISRLSVPFAAHKNFAWSCEFVRAAREERPNCSLTFIGSGDAAALVSEFAHQNGHDDMIRSRGFLSQTAVAAALRDSSILLVPSMMEAGCTVIVEAVLSGCLPLVLDHAGSGEVMRALGLGAYLLPPKTRDFGAGVTSVVPDLEAAREVLAEAYASPDTVSARIDAASSIARQKFEIRQTTRDLMGRLRRMGLLLCELDDGVSS